MRCLLSIGLASMLAGCGLARGEASAPMLQPVPGPQAGDGTMAAVSLEPVDAGTTSDETPSVSGDPEQISQSSAAWIQLGGTLQPPKQDAPAGNVDEDAWKVLLRPYAWLPKISGTVFVNGIGGRTRVTQGQVWRNLRSAGLVNVVASKGDMVYRLDGITFALADDAKIQGVPAGKIAGRIELQMLELDAGVRAMQEEHQELDVLVGLRYVYMYGRINPKNVGIQGQSGSVDWVDPVVGAIYRHRLSDEWLMLFHADYGGFGIGSASQSTYQLAALAEYKPGDRWSVGAGYRYLMIDHNSGNGASRNEQHLRFSGPVLGAAYRF